MCPFPLYILAKIIVFVLCSSHNSHALPLWKVPFMTPLLGLFRDHFCAVQNLNLKPFSIKI